MKKARPSRKQSVKKRSPRKRRPERSFETNDSLVRRSFEILERSKELLLENSASRAAPRINASPEEVRQSVAKLVLTLVEFIRRLLERQALRRMDEGTMTDAEIEGVGLALMRLEEAVEELARRFDLDPADLNLDLGSAGRLL